MNKTIEIPFQLSLLFVLGFSFSFAWIPFCYSVKLWKCSGYSVWLVFAFGFNKPNYGIFIIVIYVIALSEIRTLMRWLKTVHASVSFWMWTIRSFGKKVCLFLWLRMYFPVFIADKKWFIYSSEVNKISTLNAPGRCKYSNGLV